MVELKILWGQAKKNRFRVPIPLLFLCYVVCSSKIELISAPFFALDKWAFREAIAAAGTVYHKILKWSKTGEVTLESIILQYNTFLCTYYFIFNIKFVKVI